MSQQVVTTCSHTQRKKGTKSVPLGYYCYKQNYFSKGYSYFLKDWFKGTSRASQMLYLTIPICLRWDCCDETRFTSIAKMSFTDPRGGLNSSTMHAKGTLLLTAKYHPVSSILFPECTNTLQDRSGYQPDMLSHTCTSKKKYSKCHIAPKRLCKRTPFFTNQIKYWDLHSQKK